MSTRKFIISLLFSLLTLSISVWVYIRVERQDKLLTKAAAVIEQQEKIINRCMGK